MKINLIVLSKMNENLRLIVSDIEYPLCAGTEYGEGKVWQAIGRLADFYQRIRNPDENEIRNWFNRTSIELFDQDYSEITMPMPAYEVLIDAPRKLLDYNLPPSIDKINNYIFNHSRRLTKFGWQVRRFKGVDERSAI